MSGIGVALTPSPAFDASNCVRNLRRLMHRAGCAPYSSHLCNSNMSKLIYRPS